MSQKLGGAAVSPFFWGELGPHLAQCGRDEAYLRAKFHLDPSSHLATIHKRCRQDRQTGQTCDSMGRAVLQTVAQKPQLHNTTIYASFIWHYRENKHLQESRL